MNPYQESCKPKWKKRQQKQCYACPQLFLPKQQVCSRYRKNNTPRPDNASTKPRVPEHDNAVRHVLGAIHDRKQALVEWRIVVSFQLVNPNVSHTHRKEVENKQTYNDHLTAASHLIVSFWQQCRMLTGSVSVHPSTFYISAS